MYDLMLLPRFLPTDDVIKLSPFKRQVPGRKGLVYNASRPRQARARSIFKSTVKLLNTASRKRSSRTRRRLDEMTRLGPPSVWTSPATFFTAF